MDNRRISIDVQNYTFSNYSRAMTKHRISRKTAPSLRFAPSVKKIRSKREEKPSWKNLPKKPRKIIELYHWLLESYNSNQQKLLNMIKRELIHRNYFYEKQLFRLLTTHIYEQTIGQKYEHELEMLLEFLLEFYERRRIKEIMILEERMKEEEKYVEEKMNSIEYEKLFHNLTLRNFSRNMLDLEDQYQTICMTYGRDDSIINPHKSIKNALENSTKNLYRIFQGKLQKKGHHEFIIKKSKHK